MLVTLNYIWIYHIIWVGFSFFFQFVIKIKYIARSTRIQHSVFSHSTRPVIDIYLGAAMSSSLKMHRSSYERSGEHLV